MGHLTCRYVGCGVEIARNGDRGRFPKWCTEHRRIVANEKAALQVLSRGGYASATKFCTLDGCKTPLRARGMCKRHYTAWRRADGREKSESQSSLDRRRDAHQRRRALMHGGRTGGSVFLADVIERDGSDCRLCGDPVDMTLVYPDPMSKSVDHVVPLSRGGAHEPSNCQLAHLRCNISKGSRVAA